jgi:hypothetical protein
LPAASLDVSGVESEVNGLTGDYFGRSIEFVSLLPGQLGGIIVNPSGAVVPNAQVTVTNLETGAVRNVVTDSSGRWVVSNMSSGRIKVTANEVGFKQLVGQVNYDGSRPAPLNLTLSVGAVSESVTVTASNGPFNGSSNGDFERAQRDAKKNAEKQQMAASSNVLNLQQRVSGVLPVRVDVPRAGNSFNFVRPLVLDEETKVTFTYKSK